MKKFLPFVLLLALSLVLAACGGGKAKEEKADATPKEEQKAAEETPATEEETTDAAAGEIEPNEFGEIIDPASVDNEYFKSIHQLLKDAGYEVGDLQATDHGFFFAKQAVSFEVNGEDMLPMQIYDLDPASEHLAKAKENNGLAPATFDGQEGEIPVKVYDHYYFFIGEGHPDAEAIYKLLDEKLNK